MYFVEAAKNLIQPGYQIKKQNVAKASLSLSHFTFYAVKKACILLQIRSFNRTNGTVEIICKGVIKIKELIWKEENLNVAMLIIYLLILFAIANTRINFSWIMEPYYRRPSTLDELRE